jgi:hypothetical protein
MAQRVRLPQRFASLSSRASKVRSRSRRWLKPYLHTKHWLFWRAIERARSNQRAWRRRSAAPLDTHPKACTSEALRRSSSGRSRPRTMRSSERACRFMMIGGIAVIAHGVKRLTTDVDIVGEGASANLEALLLALATKGINPRIPDVERFARQNLVPLMAHEATGVELDISLGFCTLRARSSCIETRHAFWARRSADGSSGGSSRLQGARGASEGCRERSNPLGAVQGNRSCADPRTSCGSRIGC